MTSRTRLLVLAVSVPVIIFTLIGGYLGQVLAKDDTYQHLRVFEDVISLVLNNYVEPVNVKTAMNGRMKGLAEGLDPESSFLTPDLVKAMESNSSAGAADVGIDVTRQYYLRVISARDGSPAAKAGIRSGDFIRAIDNRPTRDMSAFEGARLLHGAPGTKVSLLLIRGNAADPHMVDLVRDRPAAAGHDVEDGGRDDRLRPCDRLHERVACEDQAGLRCIGENGSHEIHHRPARHGARRSGRWPCGLPPVCKERNPGRAPHQGRPERRGHGPGYDGAITAPVALLVDQGTAGAAEVFAAALDGNKRADLVGEHTLGRAARQKLIKLPDMSGLYLTYLRYLTPSNDQIHEKGLEPDVEVEQPEVEFGSEPPATDATLQKALEYIATKKAA
jgi:carboxyl-terminal processing protease